MAQRQPPKTQPAPAQGVNRAGNILIDDPNPGERTPEAVNLEVAMTDQQKEAARQPQVFTEAPKEEKPMETQAPPVEEEVEEKFRGKSSKEIISMYKNLESETGRHRNEVGEYRKFFDAVMQKELKQKPTETALPEPKDNIDRLNLMLSKPDEFEKLVVNKALNQFQSIQRQSLLQQELQKCASVIQDPEFQNWANQNVPEALGQAAVNDPAQLNFIINMYKNTRQPEKPAVKMETKPVGTAAGTQASTKTSGAKIWSRQEIINLRLNDPDGYANQVAEIERAYMEGRVK